MCILIPNISSSSVYATTTNINTSNISITLTNACDISVDMQSLYILDSSSTNGKLLSISLQDSSITDTYFYDTDDSTIIPGHLSSNYSPNIIVTGDNVTSIHSISPTNYTTTTLSNKYFDSATSNFSTSFASIIDVCSTLNGDVFILDTNGIIAKKDYNSNKFILVCDLSLLDTPITPSTNTQLCVSLDSSIILLHHNNTIYNIANNSLFATNYQLPTILSFQSMLLDHYNQLYVLADNTLIRSTTTSHDVVSLDSQFSNCTDFCIDYNSGTAYFITKTSLISTSITYNSTNYFNTLDQQSSNLDLSTFTPNTPLDILTPKYDNITLYQFPNLISKLDTLPLDSTFILLDDTDTNFYYVMLNYSNNANTFGYIKKSDVISVNSNITPTSYRLLLDNTPIYALPTSLNISNNTRITCTLDKYTSGQYTILTSLNSSTPPTDCNNITFIPVHFSYNNTTMFGYVDSHKIIPIDAVALPSTFVTNATTRQDISIFADQKLNSQYQTLPKGTEVFVVQTTDDICLIEWMENDTLKSGYVSHRYINDGKLSNAQLIGLIAMFSTLIISIILISIINKQKHRIRSLNDDE